LVFHQKQTTPQGEGNFKVITHLLGEGQSRMVGGLCKETIGACILRLRIDFVRQSANPESIELKQKQKQKKKQKK
jgi:hypothetical protein